MHDDIFQVGRYRTHSMFSKNYAYFSSNWQLILKTLPLDFVNMTGSDTYLESVVVMNRIKLFYSYILHVTTPLSVYVFCQCCLNSTLRFSIENTSITIFTIQSVYSLFYWQSMCVMCPCLCTKCVLSLDCSFNQIGFSNTCKSIILQHSYQFILLIVVVNVFNE